MKTDIADIVSYNSTTIYTKNQQIGMNLRENNTNK